jgi:hypothetical protein
LSLIFPDCKPGLRAALVAGLTFATPFVQARAAERVAQGEEANDIETKHIFGFTEGTDIGEAGEREMEFETTGVIGKFGGGRYNALDQLATYEVAATARLGYEVSLHGLSQQMANVPGLGNLSQTNFSGVSVMPKWIFLTRGVDAPFGLAASIEPEWDRFDPVSGVRANSFGLPVKIYLDAELIAKKLYVGANLLYAPELQKQQGEGFSHYAMAGASAALTYRITPNVAFGGEVEYDEAYNSLGFSSWGGSGTYIGPTFHVQINDKAFVAGAWSVQVANRIPAGAEGLAAYNQSDFSAQRGRLTFAIGF